MYYYCKLSIPDQGESFKRIFKRRRSENLNLKQQLSFFVVRRDG
jgi:hypothetical protein